VESIGYEEKITPLQMLTMYNAVANNGVMVNAICKTNQGSWKGCKEYNTEIINPEICSRKH